MTDLHSAHAPELIFDTHLEHFDRAEIEAVLGAPRAGPSGDAPRPPGAPPSHYAPRTPLVLVLPEDLKAEVKRCLDNGERVAVLVRTAATPQVEWLFWSRCAARRSPPHRSAAGGGGLAGKY